MQLQEQEIRPRWGGAGAPGSSPASSRAGRKGVAAWQCSGPFGKPARRDHRSGQAGDDESGKPRREELERGELMLAHPAPQQAGFAPLGTGGPLDIPGCWEALSSSPRAALVGASTQGPGPAVSTPGRAEFRRARNLIPCPHAGLPLPSSLHEHGKDITGRASAPYGLVALCCPPARNGSLGMSLRGVTCDL